MEQREQYGISGSTLKIIAVITMLTDHTAAAVLARILRGASTIGTADMTEQLRTSAAGIGNWLADLLESGKLYEIYSLMRQIGRIAFPIYCFLLVEGFLHTRNQWNYIKRLGIFVLLSEIPFDLAFSSTWLEFGYQNVYVTLLLGVLTMMLYHRIEMETSWHMGVRMVAGYASVLAGMGIAELLRTDYGALGVLCIMVLYIFRKDRTMQLVAGALSFVWWEPVAVLAFLPIRFYNGKRGMHLKYFFYLFYPVHLLFLYMICKVFGIAGISAI